MYRLAYKHIELFKKIPFDKFAVNSDFISNVVNQPEQYATYENILKAYYFIATEIWDKINNKPLLEYNKEKDIYYFNDFVKKRTEIIQSNRFKAAKIYNGVLSKDGKNRHFRKYRGLVAQPKPNACKKEVYDLRDAFLQYAYMYDGNLDFYKRYKFELPTEWAEHLYVILNKLSEKAVFFYKQRGSTILAQEMASFLSNQYAVIAAVKQIKYGFPKEKIIRQLKQKKQFMFGEITHQYKKQK